MRDNRTVSDDRATVWLTAQAARGRKPKRRSMKICVRVPSTEVMDLEVLESTDVRGMKAQIADLKSLSAARTYLVHCGQVLSDNDATIGDLAVTSGAIIWALQSPTLVRSTDESDHIIYRGLRDDEDPSQGLFPKADAADASIAEAIAGGSQGLASPFIHATALLEVARRKYADTNVRIAVINL